MILIRRVDLVEAQACQNGMDLFDAIVKKVPEGLPVEVTDPPAGWHTLANGYLEKDK